MASLALKLMTAFVFVTGASIMGDLIAKGVSFSTFCALWFIVMCFCGAAGIAVADIITNYKEPK